ncbi:44758_t:CDS:2, partial [Gigaspora margarita]
TKFEQLSANSSHSFPYFLGSLEAENVTMLQAEDRLRSSLKRISEGSSIMLDDILTSTEILIKEGLLFEKHGKALSLEDTQTLMLEYKKKELENKMDEKTTILDESNLLETSINRTIKSAKLSSMILVSTKQYLPLVLTQPCSKCNNNSLISKSWDIIPIGFQVKSTIECIKCATISEYTNESKEIPLTNAIAAAGLAGGISCNAIQSSLAEIEITNQTSNKTYHKYQKTYFAPLIASANS